MSFIRAKEIPPRSGNWYDYEVECIWNNGKPRQKVIRYIGKSVKRGKTLDVTLTPVVSSQESA